MKLIVTRFAPSARPGGCTSATPGRRSRRMISRASAGGRFLLRIEDIDGTRSRPEHVAAILDDLDWLGLTGTGRCVLQSERLAALCGGARAAAGAWAALSLLLHARRDRRASLSAPHGPEAGLSGHVPRRPMPRARMDEPHSWRLDMAPGGRAHRAARLVATRRPAGWRATRWRTATSCSRARMRPPAIISP